MAKPRNKNKYYFTQETEDAIVKYNTETNHKIRNKIFREEIDYPFNKLAENIIHTFKFYYFDVPPKRVQHEVVSFMVMKIDKFDPTNGGKAFSYFSVVAKNYLIYHNNRNYKRMKMHTSIDELSEFNEHPVMGKIAQTIEPDEILPRDGDKQNVVIINALIEYITLNVDRLFRKQRDKNIAWAIVELLKKHQTLENIHKKALYVFIREISGEETQYITRVLKLLSRRYVKIKQNYLSGNDDLFKDIL